MGRGHGFDAVCPSRRGSGASPVAVPDLTDIVRRNDLEALHALVRARGPFTDPALTPLACRYRRWTKESSTLWAARAALELPDEVDERADDLFAQAFLPALMRHLDVDAPPDELAVRHLAEDFGLKAEAQTVTDWLRDGHVVFREDLPSDRYEALRAGVLAGASVEVVTEALLALTEQIRAHNASDVARLVFADVLARRL